MNSKGQLSVNIISLIIGIVTLALVSPMVSNILNTAKGLSTTTDLILDFVLPAIWLSMLAVVFLYGRPVYQGQ